MTKRQTALILIILAIVTPVVLVSVYLPKPSRLRRADLIVSISGGDTIARTERAIELYHQGWSEQLVFSGAAKDPGSPSNAAVMRRLAVRRGVPPATIAIDETAHNTAANASGLKQAFPGVRSIILVTSPYHQRRAAREFQRVYGSSVKIIISSANDRHWHPKTWWLRPYGWWITVSELIGLVFGGR